MNDDGKMDKKEFSIAMHLIQKKLQGYELPKALPASLKADPVIGSAAGGFGGNTPNYTHAPTPTITHAYASNTRTVPFPLCFALKLENL